MRELGIISITISYIVEMNVMYNKVAILFKAFKRKLYMNQNEWILVTCSFEYKRDIMKRISKKKRNNQLKSLKKPEFIEKYIVNKLVW